jgi:hypothetical protein
MFEPSSHADPLGALTARLRELGRGWRLRLPGEVWVECSSRNGRYLVSTSESRLEGRPVARRTADLAARDALELWRRSVDTDRMAGLTRQLPFRWHTELAHGPAAAEERGRHIVLDEPIEIGRLRRGAGDALCRPRQLFWALASPLPAADGDVGCRRCVEIAGRLAAPAAARGPLPPSA